MKQQVTTFPINPSGTWWILPLRLTVRSLSTLRRTEVRK